MENLENSLSEQQQNITPPQEDTSFLGKLKTKWSVVLGILGSIAIFAVLIYAAYSYSKRGQETQLTPSPTFTVTPTITPILTPEPTAVTPTVSSEGKIAFVRDGDIWVINPDGNGEELLLEAADANGLARPLWSPQQNRLAYFEYKFPGNNLLLRIFNLESRKVQTVATLNYNRDYWLDYLVREKFDWRDNDSIIYADGKTLKQFSLHNSVTENLSTAREEIVEVQVVNSYVYYSSQQGVSRINIGTRSVEPLVSALSNFEVSLDGSYLLYIKDISSEENGSRLALWLADSLGNPIKKIAEEGPCAGFDHPKFFPDNQKFTYVVQCGDAISVYVYDVKGQKVADDFGMLYYNYSWSNDGSMFVTSDWLPRFSIAPEEEYVGIFNKEGKLIRKLFEFSPIAGNYANVQELEWGGISY